MPTVKRVENQIKKCEGFEVKILHGRDYRDMRSDSQGCAFLSVRTCCKRQHASRRVGEAILQEVSRHEDRSAEGRWCSSARQNEYRDRPKHLLTPADGEVLQA